MRLLITGANGFLGSSVVREAILCGHQVMGVSRNSGNIQDILQDIFFVQQTSNDYSSVKDSIKKFCPNAVLHFAWHGGNNYSDINSSEQFSVNIPMTNNLLNSVIETKTDFMFIGVGSFSEYGTLTRKAVESQLNAPQTYYGMAKHHAKEMTDIICKNNNIPWKWVRPCYVYGERDVPTRVLPKVIRKLIKGHLVELDSCSTKIDYLHVQDFSRGVLSLLDGGPHGVFNICSGNEYKLRDLVQMIGMKICGNTNLIRFDSLKERIDFPKYFCGSNDKIVQGTSWYPRIDINCGLNRTIEHIKKEF